MRKQKFPWILSSASIYQPAPVPIYLTFHSVTPEELFLLLRPVCTWPQALLHQIQEHCFTSSLLLLFVCLFFRATPAAMEVPGLEVESELQLPACATAIAVWDPSLVWDLHHRSPQRQVPNLLSEARDWTHNLMDTSWIHFLCTTTGTLAMPDP